MSQPFRRELSRTTRLALPVIGGQLATVGMNFIDTVMSGRVGPTTLGAVAVGSSFFGALLFFMIGVLMAVPPSVAQLDGAGRQERIGPLVRQAFWTAAGLVLLAWFVLSQSERVLRLFNVDPELSPIVVEYLDALAWGMPGLCFFLTLRLLCEGVGRTRPTLYFSLAGLAVNFVANYVLIYGHFGFPALGAVGCGYATAFVWSLQFLGILFYVHFPLRRLRVFESWDGPSWRVIVELLRVGGPIGISLFMEASLFGTVALLMGSLGTTWIAAHQMALNFTAMTFMVPLGISMAMTVRVGNAVGRRDAPGVRRAAASGFLLAMIAQLCSASAMIFLPTHIASIYTADAALIAIAVELLFLAAVFQISDGLQVASAGALRGLKDTRIPMLVTIVAYWGVGIPLGHYLCFEQEFGARGLWGGLIGGLSVAALLLCARFWSLSRALTFEAPLSESKVR
jgi:MATE family multidrug resistance protein